MLFDDLGRGEGDVERILIESEIGLLEPAFLHEVCFQVVQENTSDGTLRVRSAVPIPLSYGLRRQKRLLAVRMKRL